MNEYVYLAGAVVVEVAATLSLRAAASGRPQLYAVVIAGYVLAFTFLTFALRQGLPLGIAYGIWSAAGVALTAAAAHFLFAEAMTRRTIAGIGVIVVGVLLIELGATH